MKHFKKIAYIFKRIACICLIIMSFLFIIPTISARADDIDYHQLWLSFRSSSDGQHWSGSEAEWIEMYKTSTAQSGATFAEKEYLEKKSKLKNLNSGVWNMLENILDSSAGIGEGEVNNFLKFRSQDDSGNVQMEFTIVNAVYKYLRVIGVGMLIIYFLLDWNKQLLLSGGELNIKQLFACFMKLFLGYALIQMGPTLLSYLFQMNNQLIDGLNNAFGTSLGNQMSFEEADYKMKLIEAKTGMIDNVSKMGIMDCLSAMSGLMLINLFATLANGIIIFQAVSRQLEILIRAALMPIALGDCYNGEQSLGIRNIKKFASLVVWGFAMVVLLKLSAAASASYMASSLTDAGDFSNIGGMARLVLFPLATGGMCATLKQVCGELFGV